MIKVSVVGDKEVIASLEEKRASLMEQILLTMKQQTTNLVRYIQLEKLQGGTPLHHRSGRLQGSIKQNVTDLGNSVLAQVYTNVEYAAIHEYGGTIPAAEIVAKKAKALAFMWKGKQVFFKKVNRPAINMPERSFMRSALQENEAVIRAALTETINKVLQL